MKKKARKRKKKQYKRYISIVSSALLIILVVFFLSWELSSRKSYTVVLLQSDGTQQEYAQYPSFAQAQKEMLSLIDPSKKQNAGIVYEDSLIAIGYGVVSFQREDCSLNTSYRINQKEESGYTNGCYGNDAAYIETTEDGSEIHFKQAGVDGWVDADAVTLHNYYDENDVASIQHYIAKSHTLTHRITTNLSKANYSNALSMGETTLEDGVYYSYDGHYFYTTFEDMIDDYRNGTNVLAANQTPFYNYYQFLPLRSISNYTAEDINWYVENYLGFTSDSQSLLVNSGSWFLQAQAQYGTNAIMIFSLAMNESDFGRSELARVKNNLFGHAAYDDSPTQSASSYQSVAESIMAHAKTYLQESYLYPLSNMYHGGFFGDKASGMNVRYASDPYWGEKAADFYRTFDAVMQGKDQQFTYLISKQPCTIYQKPDINSKMLYTIADTPSSLLILRLENGWYQVQSDGALDAKGNLLKNSDYYSPSDSVGFVKEDRQYLIVK